MYSTGKSVTDRLRQQGVFTPVLPNRHDELMQKEIVELKDQVAYWKEEAIEDETERADQVHAQQEAELRQMREGYEKEVMSWKVQCFDQQYERERQVAQVHAAIAEADAAKQQMKQMQAEHSKIIEQSAQSVATIKLLQQELESARAHVGRAQEDAANHRLLLEAQEKQLADLKFGFLEVTILFELREKFKIAVTAESIGRSLTAPSLDRAPEEQRAFREDKCRLLDREAKAEAGMAELQRREATLAQQQEELAARLEAAASRDKAQAAEQEALGRQAKELEAKQGGIERERRMLEEQQEQLRVRRAEMAEKDKEFAQREKEFKQQVASSSAMLKEAEAKSAEISRQSDKTAGMQGIQLLSWSVAALVDVQAVVCCNDDPSFTPVLQVKEEQAALAQQVSGAQEQLRAAASLESASLASSASSRAMPLSAASAKGVDAADNAIGHDDTDDDTDDTDDTDDDTDDTDDADEADFDEIVVDGQGYPGTQQRARNHAKKQDCTQSLYGSEVFTLFLTKHSMEPYLAKRPEQLHEAHAKREKQLQASQEAVAKERSKLEALQEQLKARRTEVVAQTSQHSIPGRPEHILRCYSTRDVYQNLKEANWWTVWKANPACDGTYVELLQLAGIAWYAKPLHTVVRAWCLPEHLLISAGSFHTNRLSVRKKEREVAKRERESNKERAAAAKQANEVARRQAELDELDAQVAGRQAELDELDAQHCAVSLVKPLNPPSSVFACAVHHTICLLCALQCCAASHAMPATHHAAFLPVLCITCYAASHTMPATHHATFLPVLCITIKEQQAALMQQVADAEEQLRAAAPIQTASCSLQRDQQAALTQQVADVEEQLRAAAPILTANCSLQQEQQAALMQQVADAEEQLRAAAPIRVADVEEQLRAAAPVLQVADAEEQLRAAAPIREEALSCSSSLARWLQLQVDALALASVLMTTFCIAPSCSGHVVALRPLVEANRARQAKELSAAQEALAADRAKLEALQQEVSSRRAEVASQEKEMVAREKKAAKEMASASKLVNETVKRNSELSKLEAEAHASPKNAHKASAHSPYTDQGSVVLQQSWHKLPADAFLGI
ncbi:hypothetical protein DUNSADRAFT_5406 [Dunaliella salina]|uniref:Uncharacterized protein n=1 Tax=Dunaliella salina TaxID=3046 RepID=A0ABQ7GQ91_DUNSA|nr:hypothetical protein DUNSADRAFT_5406 [Dunaliella salina]|eukprot:KAF5836779.1 hypothetical protein DUNSADRAFT_5406 [Dunaliella salina]